jgi:hypothetical protein
LQLRQFKAVPEHVVQEEEQGEHTAVVLTSKNPGRQAQLPLTPDLVVVPLTFILFWQAVHAVGDEHVAQPIGQGRQIEPFL